MKQNSLQTQPYIYNHEASSFEALGVLVNTQARTEQTGIGSFFFQPRGTPHGFRVTGTISARVSYMTIPAGFDGFVLEHDQPVPYFEKFG